MHGHRPGTSAQDEGRGPPADLAARLLREIVDQYLARRHPGAAERRQFAALAGHLLAKVDAAERARAAARLAGHPATPAELLPLIAGDGPAPPAPAAAPPAGGLGRRFLDAGPAERERIIAGLALELARAPAPAADDLAPEEARAVEITALSARTSALAEALATHLALAPETAARVAADRHGEALVAAARALGLGREAALRILILKGRLALSQQRERAELAALYDAMPRAVALALVGAWRAEAGRDHRRPPRHAPVLAAEDRQGPAGAKTPRPSATMWPANRRGTARDG